MIWLGARLAFAGGRLRPLVTAGAIGFAVALLLGCLGVLPARQAALNHQLQRGPQSAQSSADATLTAEQVAQLESTALLRVRPFESVWRGRDLSGLVVAVQSGAPAPPGLRRLPSSGELAVSPALRDVLAGPHASELMRRLPGRVVATIGDEGLVGPDELFAYVGVEGSSLPDGFAALGFGGPAQPAYASGNLVIAVRLAAVGLLLPLLLLIATATRLSAAVRDQRMAAVRLVGATSGQARRLGVGEQLVSALLGTGLGLVLFLLGRGTAAQLFPVPRGVFGADIAPPTWQLLVVLGGVPLLAVGVGVFALRKALTSPLDIRRQARVKVAGWWRLAPLALGLLLLVGARVRSESKFGGGLFAFLLVGGAGLCLVGLAVAAPAFSRAAGLLLGRLSPGLSSSLAARRIGLDPAAAGRVVTGTVLVVFVAGWLLAFLPILSLSQGSSARDLARLLPERTLFVAGGAKGVDVEALKAVPGVRTVLAAYSAQLFVPGAPTDLPVDAPPQAYPSSVNLLRCADLQSLVGREIGCSGAAAYRVTFVGQDTPFYPEPVTGARELRSADGTRPVGVTVVVDRLPTLRLPVALQAGGSFLGDVLVDSDRVPVAERAQYDDVRLVVTSDGRDTTLEQLREVIGTTGTGVLTLAEQQVREEGEVRGYQTAAQTGLVVVLLVAGASLAVTTADSVRERRRGLAALVALGTPLKVLRRSVLLQIGAPLLLNVAVSLGASIVASVLYIGMDDFYHPDLPWGGWALTGLAAVAAVLVATAATLPLVSSACRPEALRAE